MAANFSSHASNDNKNKKYQFLKVSDALTEIL